MKVLVHTLDRYGKDPATCEIVHMNDAPPSLKGEDGKVDKLLIASILSDAFDDEVDGQLENFEFYELVLNKKGNILHMSGEEADMVITVLDQFEE
jgi:hypothetical protein